MLLNLVMFAMLHVFPLLHVFLFLLIQAMRGKVGNPVGPWSLAAPRRLRSLLPLGKRAES